MTDDARAAEPMRVLVCGSRTWDDEDTISARLALFMGDVTIIHGDARGADRIADHCARRWGFAVERYPADWSKHGRRAGIIRNNVMLDTKPNKVIAFWRGNSPGTRHTIEEARRRGIPVEVIRYGTED